MPVKTYHSLLREGADLLDSLRSTLLEADAVAQSLCYLV
jgi:hypothetical protein